MRIAVGSDHRGYQIKGKLVTLLRADGHEVTDFGTDSDQAVDYPDFADRKSTTSETPVTL